MNLVVRYGSLSHCSGSMPRGKERSATHMLLSAVRVPVEPVLTTAATCSTVVGSSLSSAGLLQWSKTQVYAYKRLFHSYLKLSSSRQMQGVVVAALCRQCELRAWCTASALHIFTEAAPSVLSTSPESWTARVGRANSSTQCIG